MRTFLTVEVPAWLAAHYGVTASPTERAILAISYGAKDALDAALARTARTGVSACSSRAAGSGLPTSTPSPGNGAVASARRFSPAATTPRTWRPRATPDERSPTRPRGRLHPRSRRATTRRPGATTWGACSSACSAARAWPADRRWRRRTGAGTSRSAGASSNLKDRGPVRSAFRSPVPGARSPALPEADRHLADADVDADRRLAGTLVRSSLPMKPSPCWRPVGVRSSTSPTPESASIRPYAACSPSIVTSPTPTSTSTRRRDRARSRRRRRCRCSGRAPSAP